MQSSAELKNDTLLISVPSGFKNETLGAKAIAIKQFFSSKIKGKEFQIEFKEVKTELKSDIPYTFDDKLAKITEDYPEIQDWFKALELKSR